MPENNSILLTGGAGFIGSHVAEALLRRSAHLTILDNLDSFYSPSWKLVLQQIRQLDDYRRRLTDGGFPSQIEASAGWGN